MDTLVRLFKSEEIPVYEPGEVEYERSAAVANLLYRFSRPELVVQPEDSSHVQIIVQQAKEQKIPITIKNAGHSYAGFSTTNKGILLDLVRMKRVSLDIKSETVTLQGGAQWGHAYKKLVNGHHDGYIINGGRCPTVGVSGFILGGGLSPFTRSLGMGCDSLLEATIVTADGNEVTVKYSSNPKSNEDKLFWALCGAGGGNFGVVVRLKMKVQKLKDEEVVAGRYTWYPKPDKIDDFMSTMKDFYTEKWDNGMTIDTSWLCDLQHTTSDLGVRFIAYYDGSKKDFDDLIDKFAKRGETPEWLRRQELAEQLIRRSLPEQSTRFLHETLVNQWSEEIVKAFPSNRSYSIYASFVFENDEETIGKVTATIKKGMADFRAKFKGDQGLLQVTWIHSGGKASEKEFNATAFPWRKGVYFTYVAMQWNDKWLEKNMRGFLESFKKGLTELSLMKYAAYVNFPDAALSPDAHEEAYFGDNRQALQGIKGFWDKDNFFKWAQGVQPPPQDEITVLRSAAAGEEVRGEKALMGEQDLTDKIAREHWKTGVPRKNDFEGGIYGLTDLGF